MLSLDPADKGRGLCTPPAPGGRKRDCAAPSASAALSDRQTTGRSVSAFARQREGRGSGFEAKRDMSSYRFYAQRRKAATVR